MNSAGEIIAGSLAPKSRQAYNNIFKEYQVFSTALGFTSVSLENPGMIILYLSHLFNKGIAANTLFSRASALAYVLKLRGVQDPTQHFLVKKFLKGAKHLRPSADIRQPMTLQILQQSNSIVSQQVYSCYYQILYKCMFNVAFFAFLRPGEMTSSVHNLQFQQVQVIKNCLHVTFLSFKHYHGRPVTLSIQPQRGQVCPVTAVTKFLKVRGQGAGPFFVNPDGSPVTYS